MQREVAVHISILTCLRRHWVGFSIKINITTKFAELLTTGYQVVKLVQETGTVMSSSCTRVIALVSQPRALH